MPDSPPWAPLMSFCPSGCQRSGQGWVDRPRVAEGPRQEGSSSQPRDLKDRQRERRSQQMLVFLDTQTLFLAPISKQTWSFFNRKLEMPSHL